MFHFSSFISFLPFFFFCAKMSPSSTSFAWYYFQFYPYWPLVNPSKGTPTPSELLGKLQSLLPLLLCYYRSWTISTHPPIPVFFRVIHSLRHPSAQGPLFLLMSQENPGYEVARGYTIHVFLVKDSMHVSVTCWRRLPPLSFAAHIIIPLSSSSSPSNMINTRSLGFQQILCWFWPSKCGAPPPPPLSPHPSFLRFLQFKHMLI